MKRSIPCLWLAVTLASACTSAPQTSAPPPASIPSPSLPQAAGLGDPLPSWNEGRTKTAIRDFVRRVTTEGSPDFVPVADRIATFDNDGTLWAEKPLPFQLLFALDRVKALASEHPEWATKEPFASLLKGDVARYWGSGSKGLAEILAVTHAGMTTDEFAPIVKGWMTTARHPQTGRKYTEMVYQPMVELLAFLRANGFKTYIASGGGVEFMRGWAERVYGIPPEQVIGSVGKAKFEMRDGTPVLVKLPEIDFVDDGKASPLPSRTGSAAAPSPRSATRTGTCRCCSGPWPVAVRGLRCSSITTTRLASLPTTGRTRSSSSTRAGMRRSRRAGPS